MNTNNKSENLYKYYSSFSTSELEKILKLDFFASEEELSPETIQIILSVLHSRENAENLTFHIDKGWDSFKNNYLPFVETDNNIFHSPTATPIQNKAKRPFYKKRELAAVLVISIITVSMFSTTATAQSLFSYIANWSKESFWFNHNDAPIDYDQSTLKFTLENNYDLTNIPEDLLPIWIPNGFVKKSIDSYENSSEKVVCILFENKKNKSILSITISQLLTEVTKIYEKDDSNVKIYQKNGIDYYLMSNLNTNTAIWKNDSFECQIDGEISHEYLIKMIDSISSTN